MMFLNDYNIQELESDTVFLQKTKEMYRYTVRDVETLTSQFSNKAALQFFIGKNKNEIYDDFLISGTNVLTIANATRVLEKVCLSESVEMAYKKHIVQAFSRMMHSKPKKYRDKETEVKSSYLFIIHYLYKNNQLEIFNQACDLYPSLWGMISETQWGNDALIWAYCGIAKLFLAIDHEKLASGGTVKYGASLEYIAALLVSKHNPASIDAELVKKVLCHIQAVRSHAATSKGSSFFHTTTTHIFTSTIRYESNLKLLEENSADNLESLFEYTIDELAELFTESYGTAAGFGVELKKIVAKKLLGKKSPRVVSAILPMANDFKNFLMEVLPEMARITTTNDADAGDLLFKNKLSKYLHRDSHSSMNNKYSLNLEIFKSVASVDDIADIYCTINTLADRQYAMPYYWAKQRIINVSMVRPIWLSRFSKDDAVQKEQLIDKIIERGGSLALCGEVFYRLIKENYLEKKTIDNYDKIDKLFGKYGAYLGEFNLPENIIEKSEYYVFFANRFVSVINYIKNKPIGDKDYDGIIRSIFSQKKDTVVSGISLDSKEDVCLKDPLALVDAMVESGVIDKRELINHIGIADGVSYGFLDADMVKERIINLSGFGSLAATLKYFSRLSETGGCAFAKDIVEFMISPDFGKHLDAKFAGVDKYAIMEWRDAIEDTMLSAGKMLPNNIDEAEKAQKAKDMFMKHFGVSL